MESVYLNEDQLLLQRVREGDEESFNILYKKYWLDVYNISLRLLKNHPEAQDVTQGMFIDLWLKREELEINNIKGYMYVAVRNRILRIFEKKKYFIPFEALIKINSDSLIIDESADYLTLKNEFLQAYKSLLDSLPSQRKKIFNYYFDENLSTEEIARQLSLSRKTVQNQLGRAVSFLKTNLSQLGAILLILFF